MKYFKILIGILFLVLIYISCERDDICSASQKTTPKLILEGFNNLAPDRTRGVAKLRILGEEKEEPLSIFIGNAEVPTIYDGSKNEAKIYLPLRTDANQTTYRLRRDYALDDNGTTNDPSDDFPTGNEDTIVISYEREEVFVSRSCGFRTIFKNVSIRWDETDNWIKNIAAINENQSIEDEEETHFILLH